jgi:hypothetical protein
VRATWSNCAGAVLAFVIAAMVLSACSSGEGGGPSNEGSSRLTERSNPQERVEAVNLDGIHSGSLEVTGNLLQPSVHEEVYIRFGAQFRRLGEEDLPPVQIYASAQNEVAAGHVDFNSSLMLLPKFGVAAYGHAYHESGYELEPDIVEAVRRKLEEAQESDGNGDLMACVEAAEGIELSQLLQNVKGERPHELSRNTPLYAVIAEINLPRLASALNELAEDPRCGAQLTAMGLPSASELKAVEARVEEQIEGTKIKIALAEDGVPHLIYAVAVFKSPPGVPDTFTFVWRLNSVNEVGPLFPSPGTRTFGALLRRFGTNMDAVLEGSPDELVLGFLKGLSGGLTGRLP